MAIANNRSGSGSRDVYPYPNDPLATGPYNSLKPGTFSDLPEGEQDQLMKDDPSNVRDWEQTKLDQIGDEVGGPGTRPYQAAQQDMREAALRALKVQAEKQKQLQNRAESRAILFGNAPGQAPNYNHSPIATLDVADQLPGVDLLTPEEEAAFGAASIDEFKRTVAPLLRGKGRPEVLGSYTGNPDEFVGPIYDRKIIPVGALPEELLEQLPDYLRGKYLRSEELTPEERGIIEALTAEKVGKIREDVGISYTDEILT